MKKTRIPKFWSHPWAAVPSGLVIFGQGQKIKIPLPTFFWPRPLDSKEVQHDPTGPKPQEEIDLA